MKRGPLALVSSIVVAAGIVCYVHYKQEDDIYQMRKGVIRDRERERTKQENSRKHE